MPPNVAGRKSQGRRASMNQSRILQSVQPLELVFADLTYDVKVNKKKAGAAATPHIDAPAVPAQAGEGGAPVSPSTALDGSRPAGDLPTANGPDEPHLQAENGEAPRKVILKAISGIFRPGRLTAIMGPSGAGKTSLLDVLAGNVVGGHISGTIMVNGERFSGKNLKEISGFVFQDDVLLETMTVREAIAMSAILRLPESVSLEERRNRVDDIIHLLNLTKCQDTNIGSPMKRGISGGERKRTSTAMELIANPPMLFLDEPTSGLDTFTAFTVIRSLSKLAHRQGRTVIATVHQPSSEIFHLFDDLLLLSQGEIVYAGEVAHAVDYFTSIGYPCPQYSNPADFFFMDVLRQFTIAPIIEEHNSAAAGGETSESSAGSSPLAEGLLLEAHASPSGQATAPSPAEGSRREPIAAWRASPEYARLCEDIENHRTDGVAHGTVRKRAPFSTQFFYLLRRAWKNAIRNKMIVIVKAIKALFLGTLVGLTFLDSSQYSPAVQVRNKSGAIYFLALNEFFGSTLGVVTIFYVEKQVFFREYQAGYYTTTPYFFTKLLVELPFNYFFPYVMVIIAYYMIGLSPPFSDYLMSATFVALASIGGVSVGMLISSIFDNLQVILAVTPVILLPLLLFSGIFVSSGSLPVYFNWIKYISPIYYAFVGMMQVEFSSDLPNCNAEEEVCSGSLILDSLGLSSILPMGVNVVLEVVLWAAYTLFAYIALSVSTRMRFGAG